MRSASVRQAGYTIVETMIFLIVSAVLLLSALTLFNGRIPRAEFTQSVQAFASQLQTTASQVSTGTYNSPAFSCTLGILGAPNVDFTQTATQGTRSGCIF